MDNDFEIGDLVLWDTPITGETHCGTLVEFRHGHLPGTLLPLAAILPLEGEELVTVDVAGLRSLAEEVRR